MKIHFKLFVLLLILLLGSCKDDEAKVLCAEVLLPMTVNINYVDENGKDLFFGDNSAYSIEDLYIYKIESDDEVPIHFSADKEAKHITLSLSQSVNGTFFIELTPDETDEISFIAEVDESDPCKNHVVTKLKQNNNDVQYDKQNDIWILVK